jgi:phosphatidylinositol 4-kinase
MSSFGPSEVNFTVNERPTASGALVVDGDYGVGVDMDSPVGAHRGGSEATSSATHADHQRSGGLVQSRSASDLESPQIPRLDAQHRAQSFSDEGARSAHQHDEPMHSHQFAHIRKEVAADNIAHTDLSPEGEKLTPAEVTKKVVSSAKELLDSGAISEKEYEMLLRCDNKYRDESHRNEIEVSNQRIFECFGESWIARKERIIGALVYNSSQDAQDEEEDWPLYDLRCFIVKSNDDLRQEVCCLQLIELCQEIFSDIDDTTTGCKLWLKTYRILSTNATTGIVQVIPDTQSLDALKKTDGFTTLRRHFDSLYGISPERYKIARRNFVASLAAYSLVTYIFQIKDRHNGNILIDKEGHIIHIDFGFLLGIAPGGSFSIESAPFKLTEEMVDVFGGLESPLFSEFLKVFTSGFLALKANSETILSTIALMAQQSTFPCFTGRDANQILDKLRGRFRHDLNVSETVQHCLDLIIQSYGNYGTKQYDNFQWLTNGIMP